MYTILYIKYKTDKDLQYSTRNYTQDFAISSKGKESEKNRGVCVCVCLCVCLVAKSCPTLASPWTVAHQDPLSMGFSRQEFWSVLPCPPPIFPTQGSNPGLPHCGWILYQLSHKGSPRILGWVAYPLSSGFSQLRNQTGVSCIAGGFFTI